ncbi:MAG: VWA domain-containing protein [Planctomycetota bacterium]|nr:VWA domain-containing protein [Planctomycetota bacterium]
MKNLWIALSRRIVGSRDSQTYSSLTVAAAVHVCVFAILAQFSRFQDSPIPPIIRTAWKVIDDELPEHAVTIAPEKLANERASLISGGINSGQLFQTRRVTAAQTPQVRTYQGTLAASSSDTELPSDLTEVVDGAKSAGASGVGGTGQGEGEGQGDPNGFFGVPVVGQRIVYVVDCSRSMNHPHDSEAKTRFRRLKLEITKSIRSMAPQMEFYIIFFNDQAHPMPAKHMQPALPRTQLRYLNWLTQVRAVGDTDPRQAMGMAVRMQPDVIYFLTDGSFDKSVQADLLKLRVANTTIHTFAFGERDGERTMKLIARNNNGRYHFIP